MSRFLTQKFASLEPYVPGEQPQDLRLIKLNTNESPYPPAPRVRQAAAEQASCLNYYADPDCTALREKLAQVCGTAPENVFVTNGSDEALAFLLQAFGDEGHPFCFPDLTYSFYAILCRFYGVPFTEIPLQADFTVDPADYRSARGHLLLANPNAPTGFALPVEAIERIACENPDRLVVVDEAYVDFGWESCIPLTKALDNVLVVQTFSKSRSLAGGRLGFAVGCEALIADLNALKAAANPYSVNRMTLACGLAALEEADYCRENCRRIIETRADTTKRLRELGFSVLPSQTNFVLAEHPAVSGEALCGKLRARGILVRHFDHPRIANYNRITIGSREQMDVFLQAVNDILSEVQP